MVPMTLALLMVLKILVMMALAKLAPMLIPTTTMIRKVAK
jgi:hypothetical protein